MCFEIIRLEDLFKHKVLLLFLHMKYLFISVAFQFKRFLSFLLKLYIAAMTQGAQHKNFSNQHHNNKF